MAVLLIAEYDNNTLSEQTARCLNAALQIDNAVDILVAGKNLTDVAHQAAQLSGVRQILLADNAVYDQQRAETISDLIVSLADPYDCFIAPASTMGKSIMPRVAALLDVMQISEIIAVVAPDTFKRPIYAGNAIQVVQSNDDKKVITVRCAAFTPVAKQDSSCPIQDIAYTSSIQLSTFIKNEIAMSDRPELSSARIVISGGRALGSAEQFKDIIFPLADRLGAAVGASRAAVDAGYAANDLQVGQTGKIVAPDLYIACGISGAIQHLAGMKDSKIIVAINKDGEAPIFQVADYGLVGDLFDILPELLQKLD